ncbi:MAG: hypothetical protein LC114_22515 [Bryobacterales bacterium]|nr:hypothetical protein [Bryobacterales bacterium]
MSMDWSATLLEVGGGRAHPDYPLDGVSPASMLRDPGRTLERPLHWRMNRRQQHAPRQGDWRYLKVDEHEYQFNIASDERERANLSHQHPELLAALRDAWLRWNTSMPGIPPDGVVNLGNANKDMPQR